MKFRIWGVGFYVDNIDDYIKCYIKNRFAGFITEFEKNDYLIKKSSYNLKEYISKNYGFVFDADCKETEEYESEDIYLVYISQIALLVFEKCKKTIQYQIFDISNHKIYGFLSIKICEFVMNALYINDIFCLHCSVVTFNKDINNGIAFVGESGSGKTSLSLKFIEMGEKITNDDIAYFKLFPSCIKVIKNTQCVGVDDDNLKDNFNYLKGNIIKKDELEFDKNRIDLFEYNNDSYVDSIDVKTIVFLSKERGMNVELKEIASSNAALKLIKSCMQFSTKKVIGKYIDALSNMANILKTYSLYSSNSLNETVIYVKNFFNSIF